MQMAGIAEKFVQNGRKIVGVGFNYKSLVKQLGVQISQKPRVYLKAASSYVTQGQKIQIPKWSKEGIWYEVELGVVIGKHTKDISPTNAMDCVAGYCTALDMTDKNAFLSAREERIAWAVAKSFDSACAVGDFIPKDKIPDYNNVDIWLDLNGDRRQEGHSGDMTWSVPELVSIISEFMVLEPGDMVLTGTPAGMDTCAPGDVIDAGIKGVDTIRFEVAK